MFILRILAFSFFAMTGVLEAHAEQDLRPNPYDSPEELAAFTAYDQARANLSSQLNYAQDSKELEIIKAKIYALDVSYRGFEFGKAMSNNPDWAYLQKVQELSYQLNYEVPNSDRWVSIMKQIADIDSAFSN